SILHCNNVIKYPLERNKNVFYQISCYHGFLSIMFHNFSCASVAGLHNSSNFFHTSIFFLFTFSEILLNQEMFVHNFEDGEYYLAAANFIQTHGLMNILSMGTSHFIYILLGDENLFKSDIINI
ncbi:hypothetical protein ACJX0J_018730, partial [Zea mays]